LSAQMRAENPPVSQALALHLEKFSVRHIGECYLDVLELRPTHL
jgi:hypothetical protein